MKHKAIEKSIQKRLDAELGPEERARLDQHLAQCAECSRFSEGLSQVARMVRHLEDIHPRVDFNSRVLERIGLKRRFAWARVGIGFAAAWAAAILAFALSPLPVQILGKLSTSFPAVVRFFDKAGLILTTFGQTIMPFCKTSVDTSSPFIGLVFGILFIYILGRTLQKEAKCIN
jgi:anti-sigma factor RsiW